MASDYDKELQKFQNGICTIIATNLLVADMFDNHGDLYTRLESELFLTENNSSGITRIQIPETRLVYPPEGFQVGWDGESRTVSIITTITEDELEAQSCFLDSCIEEGRLTEPKFQIDFTVRLKDPLVKKLFHLEEDAIGIQRVYLPYQPFTQEFVFKETQLLDPTLDVPVIQN